MANLKLVVFDIDGENFGVDVDNVDTIQETMNIFKVPNAPESIEGLINLRGKIYTVFNLRKKFSLPARELDESSKIMIIKFENLPAGFIVDQVNEILPIEEVDIEDIPDTIGKPLRRYMTGIAKKGEKLILILDLRKILTPSEEEAAAALAKGE